jgi:hypothetical protein
MTELVVAEAQIRQLQARYTDAVWRQDYAAFADCFTEDGEWRISGMILRGRPQIKEAIERILGNFRRVLISFGTPHTRRRRRYGDRTNLRHGKMRMEERQHEYLDRPLLRTFRRGRRQLEIRLAPLSTALPRSGGPFGYIENPELRAWQ